MYLHHSISDDAAATTHKASLSRLWYTNEWQGRKQPTAYFVEFATIANKHADNRHNITLERANLEENIEIEIHS
jgi:hypothetical protein